MPRRTLILVGLAASLVASSLPPQDDPVVKARTQRAATQGGQEGDLPPVPRGIVEPPPLPPPEAHVKDTRRGRRARSRAKRHKVTSRTSKGPAKRPSKKVKGKQP